MPTLFDKNVTLAAKTTNVAGAAQTFRLLGVQERPLGSRCELCHQPNKKSALIEFETGERREIGLDCLERLDYIRRSGCEPEKAQLTAERKARRAWRSDVRRRPIVASAVAFLRQRRDALPKGERQALEFLEVAGHPRTIEEGESLLTYYRQADPLWLLRIVRQKRPDWRNRFGTVLILKVTGIENFRQVRERNPRYTFLGHFSGRRYVHEWTYDRQKGVITFKRYSRDWYEEYGNYRSWLKKPTQKKPKTITATFEEGVPNLIAKRPSDLGPYVVLDFRVAQPIEIKVGTPYQIEITRVSTKGTTRFCRVLAPA